MARRARRLRLWPAAGTLLAACALAIAADFVAPYDYAAQHRDRPFAPPTRLHFVDPEGRFHWRPFVHPSAEVPGSPGEYREDRGRMVPLRLLVAGSRPGGAGHRPRLFGVDEPDHVFLLGTDRYGRDQLSRLVYGGRISLFAGLLAGVLAVGLGLVVGSVAGYFGGWVDDVLMRGAELFLALPWLYLLIAARAFLPLHVPPAAAFLLMVAVIGAVGWAAPARLIRGVVLSARERDFVRAARGFGASHGYVLRRHVMPQAYAVALTQLALRVPRYVLAEVTLSFLGLGVAEPVPSWGNLLAELQRYPVAVSYWWMYLPGLVLVAVVLSYHQLADAVRERLGVVTV